VQVFLDKMFHQTMLELHQRVHPKHTVVGWFATGSQLEQQDLIYQVFYSTGRASGCGVKHPMHLVLDTDLSQDDRLSVKTYVTRRLALGGVDVATEFVEVPTTILTTGPEGLALDSLREEKLDTIPDDSENFRRSFEKLQSLTKVAKQYVADVLAGKRPADVTIGRCVIELNTSCLRHFHLTQILTLIV
jgi:translation initiation factor 3 subunit F